MSLSKTIDYAALYFEKEVLDEITGRPDYAKLARLFKDLKANASKVTSGLGGGIFGHLGLVMTAIAYARISAVAYERQAMPAPLVIPPGTAQHAANRMREDWKEEVALFRETIDVENALKKQLIAAIEPQYLDDRRNPDTNSITEPIATTMAYLFQRYGNVTQVTLDSEARKVQNMTYLLTDPINNIFQAVQELGQLADAASNPYTDRQLLEYGLNIIRNTHDFELAQISWNQRPIADKTWANFKTHFVEALTQLELVRGTTMQPSAFHQAHALVQQTENVLAGKLEGMEQQFLALAQQSHENENENNNTDTAPSALIQKQIQMQERMLNAFENITTKLDNQLNANMNQPPPNANQQGRGKKTYTLAEVNAVEKYWNKPNCPFKYCWTHGSQRTHDSSQCNKQGTGHKEDATFDDRKGGRTWNIVKHSKKDFS